MKMMSVPFYFHRARIFGWLVVLSIVGYTVYNIVIGYTR